jgi:hypothetical protein
MGAEDAVLGHTVGKPGELVELACETRRGFACGALHETHFVGSLGHKHIGGLRVLFLVIFREFLRDVENRPHGMTVPPNGFPVSAARFRLQTNIAAC